MLSAGSVLVYGSGYDFEPTSGQLVIHADGNSSEGEQITVSADPETGQLLVNGDPVTTVSPMTTGVWPPPPPVFLPVLAHEVRSIFVIGGPGADTIDLSGVTLAAFVNLESVVVDGGAGDDLIIGSQFDQEPTFTSPDPPDAELSLVWHNARLAYQGPDGVGSDGPMGKLGFPLTLLYFEWQHFGETGHSFSPTSSPIQFSSLMQVSDGSVLVVAISNSADAAALQSDMESIGSALTDGSPNGKIIGAWVPIDALDELAAFASLDWAQPAIPPHDASPAIIAPHI